MNRYWYDVPQMQPSASVHTVSDRKHDAPDYSPPMGFLVRERVRVRVKAPTRKLPVGGGNAP